MVFQDKDENFRPLASIENQNHLNEVIDALPEEMIVAIAPEKYKQIKDYYGYGDFSNLIIELLFNNIPEDYRDQVPSLCVHPALVIAIPGIEIDEEHPFTMGTALNNLRGSSLAINQNVGQEGPSQATLYFEYLDYGVEDSERLNLPRYSINKMPPSHSYHESVVEITNPHFK